jgi:hypothetical protein
MAVALAVTKRTASMSDVPRAKHRPTSTLGVLRFVVQVSSTKPFYDATLLAQFEEYRAIHRAGVALDLWTEWEKPSVAAIDEIANMLRKHAGIDPQNAELSFVAMFLQQQVDRQANNKAPATSAPTIHEGECAGESGRPEGGGVANGVDGPGTAKRKRRDGKRPLEQSNPLKFQIYDRIRQAHMRGENYVDTVTRLKEDKDFMEQVEEAGEKVDTKLVLNQAKLSSFSGRRIMKNSKSPGFSGV